MSDVKVSSLVTGDVALPVAQEKIHTYDLCLAWNWPYDADFAGFLMEACWNEGVSFLQVTPENLENILLSLVNRQCHFRVLLDRASDTDDGFNPLVLWARQQGIRRINPTRLARRAWDKIGMHQKLVRMGLRVPETIFLPPCYEQPHLPPVENDRLGECFVVKPAHEGGGKGVVLGVSTCEQVQAARHQFPHDSYLLQAIVTPATLDGRPAWFRVIFCAGQVFPCWWNPQTHQYALVTSDEQSLYHLQPLREIAALVAQACRLQLFSSEIALTAQGEFILVDYVNDPIDLRLQSKAPEGVPDAVIHSIVHLLARYAACYAHRQPALIPSPPG